LGKHADKHFSLFTIQTLFSQLGVITLKELFSSPLAPINRSFSTFFEKERGVVERSETGGELNTDARLALSKLKMSRISRRNLITAHQPIHGHFARHSHSFNSVKCSENAIPNACGYAMVVLGLMKMVIEMMFP